MRRWSALDKDACFGQRVQVISDPIGADDLRLLAALSATVNVRRAANALGIPRSTLSWRLSQLEERLGASVFLRRGRTLKLSRYGESLAKSTERAQEALEELQRVASEADAKAGRLVVAASPLFAEEVLPPVLAVLLAAHPELRVELRLSHTYADIFDEKVDVALRRGPLADSASLTARRLGHMTMTCVASPALAASASADDLGAAPWIRIGGSAEPFMLDVRVGRSKRTIRATPRVAVDSQRIAIELARRGAGVAKVNLFMVREDIRSGRLREIFPEARSGEDAFAVYPRRSRPSALLKHFLGALIAEKDRLHIWD